MADGTDDYIIVGAGSAGCVLANRLTADDSTILVLEAGSTDDQREIHIPAAFPELFKTDVDWEYYTEAQPVLDGRELYGPRGKVLGGSSSMSAMIYIRGHPGDYDRRAELGNEGGVGGRVAVLRAGRTQRALRRPVPRHGRAAQRCRLGQPESAVGDLRGGGTDVGLPRNDDFNSFSSGISPSSSTVLGCRSVRRSTVLRRRIRSC